MLFQKEHTLNTGKNHPNFGKHLSEEIKLKIGKANAIALKGKKRTPFSEEHKMKLKQANLGKKHSEETIEKIRLNKLGKKHSLETREKMKKSHRGFRHTIENRKKMSLLAGGIGEIRIIKDYYHIKDFKYKEWRNLVFQRDNWTCQNCKVKSGSGKSIFLQPHHIRGWTKYPELRYKIDNGITLCQNCHRLTYKGSRKTEMS